MADGLQHQKAMVDSGKWMLYRYDPRKEAPMQLDSKGLKMPVSDFLQLETRFRNASPELVEAAQKDVNARWKLYSYLSKRDEG